MKKTKRASHLVALMIACIAAAGMCFLLYHYDNKYIKRAPVTQGGVAYLNQEKLVNQEIIWLVEGWEIYPGVIAEPSELSQYEATPLYIGQYFSFSSLGQENSPYGVATYRLYLQGEQGEYDLFLPEVFCASKVYVNGQLVQAVGSISPYAPYVQDTIVPISVNGLTEVVIQTANYSHYYSGITYPPAIGTPNAVDQLVSSRLLLYGVLCFSSLSIALFSAGMWVGTHRENKLFLWFGLLTLSFALRVCYPFFHRFGVPLIQPLYALEDSMTLFGLLCVAKITLLLCFRKPPKWTNVLLALSGGFTLLGALVPLAILNWVPAFAPIYGQLIYWYKLIFSMALLALVLMGGAGKAQRQNTWILCGMGIYGVSLIARAVMLGRYEPAYTAWPDEWGAYLLVVCFAVRMVMRNLELVRRNAHLTYHLQEEVRQKTASLTTLLTERRQLLAGFTHDLKTPISSISTFTHLVEEGNVGLDEETQGYLKIIHQKIEDMRQQVEEIQRFTIEEAKPIKWEPLDLTQLVQQFYETNLPDIEVAGIDFRLERDVQGPLWIQGDAVKLKSVLQNLLYNAVSFTPEEGSITLSLAQQEDKAIVAVKDTGQGIDKEDLSHVFDLFFSKREAGNGLGLYLCKSIVQEHGGLIEVQANQKHGTVFTMQFPLITQGE